MDRANKDGLGGINKGRIGGINIEVVAGLGRANKNGLAEPTKVDWVSLILKQVKRLLQRLWQILRIMQIVAVR